MSESSSDESTAESDASTSSASTAAHASTGSATADDSAAPTPQADRLRRQQFYVGAGGSALVAIAVTVALFQRYPDAPLAVPVAAGVLAGAVVLRLVTRSIFPGESEQ